MSATATSPRVSNAPYLDSNYSYFDLARGLAALTVFAGHLRGFVFIDYLDAHGVGIIWKIFYFMTGLGHQAVMVFFVLSGFLIGRNVATDVKAGTWSWPDYAIKRLSRLWIVLIPALLLTAFFDQLGRGLTHSPFYAGELFTTYHSGPEPNPASSPFSMATLGWNAIFLQTIVAPPFGSNGPLWSLANEFWYYLLFPIVFLTFSPRDGLARRAVLAAGALLLCLWLPGNILAGGVIWLFGFAAWLASIRVKLASRPIKLLAVFATLGILIGALVLSRFAEFADYSDFAVGAAFALLLIPMTQLQIRSRALRGFSNSLSRMSYTLYLAHFPVAGFIASWALANKRFAPGIDGCLIYIGLFAGILAYAWVLYLCFERRTPAMQRWLIARLPGK